MAKTKDKPKQLSEKEIKTLKKTRFEKAGKPVTK